MTSLAGGRGGPAPRAGRGGSAPSAGRGEPAPSAGSGDHHGRGRIPRPTKEIALDHGASSEPAREKAVEGTQEHKVDTNAGPSSTVDADHAKKRKRKDATVKLDCSICTEEHFTNLCPLLRGPKPSVTFCGAAEDGMGFFQIQTGKKHHIVDTFQSACAALITVEIGEVSTQLLQTELARIIPVRWDWEVQQLGAKSFVVPFPSKKELDRMMAIGTFTTKNKEGTITFEEYVDDVQPFKILEQVWVTVTKVPRLLHSFLPLWAVGTIIGSTQKVDIIHLRATGQVHILVAVYDVKKIPKFVDVCVGTGIYRLFFKADVAVQGDPIDPDDNLLEDSDKEPEGSDREMEDAEPDNPQNNTTASDKQPAPTHNLPPPEASGFSARGVGFGMHAAL